MWSKGKLGALLMVCMVLLAACSKEDALNTMNAMEDTVNTENQMQEYLQKIADLEGQDLELYDLIMEQGKDADAKLDDLLEDALKHVDDRKEHLESAKQIMDAAKAKSKSWRSALDVYNNDAKEQEMVQKADQLWNDYEARQATFGEFYEQYNLSLAKDKELYVLLEEQDEAITLSKLKSKVSERNKAFAKANKLKQQFNKETSVFNKEHESFVVEMQQHLSKNKR
ncbi:YkyA family protein [Paenibacillus gallinarum]|uniref:YkyA family protein n=1 Tax=Paenibacillus gallinarum TaxID=2762232 RepID=A0ABR8T338_9BACL|nr:YkyA family protein [Paenibacillus gallinarum]MBD7970188.1 YkyA family protein [Paenibacillus gallinarum]